MRIKVRLFLFFLVIFVLQSPTFAQRSADNWNRLLEQKEGWLGADGIYTVDLNRDVITDVVSDKLSPQTLFIFSDTISGETRKNGSKYGQIAMTNHSFAILTALEPRKDAITFFWHKPENGETPAERPQNIVDGHYWLQDGVRYGNRLWLTAILVGKAWKPERIDALSFPLDRKTNKPDFSRPSLNTNAPLSLRTSDAQVVMGAAICDDADDGNLYIFGYVDRFSKGSRKDAVVARVPRNRLENYEEWRFYNGREWQEGLESLAEEKATIVRGVSTEYSVSKIPAGKAAGKWLMVYTPGTISEKIAFRIGKTPYGPFGEEHIFWKSTLPQEMGHVSCYNAKAHPIFTDKQGVLVSFNVNRLGELAQKPAEYRPRFVWLDWSTLEEAEQEDASK